MSKLTWKVLKEGVPGVWIVRSDGSDRDRHLEFLSQIEIHLPGSSGEVHFLSEKSPPGSSDHCIEYDVDDFCDFCENGGDESWNNKERDVWRCSRTPEQQVLDEQLDDHLDQCFVAKFNELGKRYQRKSTKAFRKDLKQRKAERATPHGRVEVERYHQLIDALDTPDRNEEILIEAMQLGFQLGFINDWLVW